MHTEIPAGKQYVKNKISGVFPLSQGYGKTMLCHQIFENLKHFDYPALFYNNIEECVALISNFKKIEKFISPGYERIEKGIWD